MSSNIGSCSNIGVTIAVFEEKEVIRMSDFAFENQKYHKLYINGKWVDPAKGGKFSTINPATGIHSNLPSIFRQIP